MTQVTVVMDIEALLCLVFFVILALIVAHYLIGGKIHVDFSVSEKIIVFIAPSPSWRAISLVSARRMRASSLSRSCRRRSRRSRYNSRYNHRRNLN